MMFPLACLTAARSRKDLVSGRQSRKMMIKTGGQAPNQYRGLQPCEVVSTRPRAKAVASRYPKAYPCCSMPDIKPRAASGQSSNAVAAAFPYSPPMAMPKSARQARNCL